MGGDAQNPYPTDQEIREAARLGFTLFQMHRVGMPGEPRPPAGQLERVIQRVHESGMLFLWTENADLMYANAPAVVELVNRQVAALAGIQLRRRYRPPLTPTATRGHLPRVAERPGRLPARHVKTLMIDQYRVDGMYLDDNLAYANCEAPGKNTATRASV